MESFMQKTAKMPCSATFMVVLPSLSLPVQYHLKDAAEPAKVPSFTGKTSLVNSERVLREYHQCLSKVCADRFLMSERLIDTWKSKSTSLAVATAREFLQAFRRSINLALARGEYSIVIAEGKGAPDIAHDLREHHSQLPDVKQRIDERNKVKPGLRELLLRRRSTKEDKADINFFAAAIEDEWYNEDFIQALEAQGFFLVVTYSFVNKYDEIWQWFKGGIPDSIQAAMDTKYPVPLPAGEFGIKPPAFVFNRTIELCWKD
jgi:hypothetical protein